MKTYECFALARIFTNWRWLESAEKAYPLSLPLNCQVTELKASPKLTQN